MKKIIIFDMDGTLIDSKKDITISINYVRKTNHNLPPLSEAFVVDAINKEVRNLPKLFYNTQMYEERDRKLFEHHYKKQCIVHSSLYDGVFELLLALKKQGVYLSVATNAPTIFAQTMLEHLEVAKFFDFIIGADKVAHSKPNPEMLLYILNRYNYDAAKDKACMVGDNSKDMKSAINAGVEAIFAAWGFSQYGEYSLVLKDPKEILGVCND